MIAAPLVLVSQGARYDHAPLLSLQGSIVNVMYLRLGLQDGVERVVPQYRLSQVAEKPCVKEEGAALVGRWDCPPRRQYTVPDDFG